MSVKKQVIAVDIDDVLSTNAADFIAYSNKKFNTNLSVDDYSEHWAELWKVDHEEAERRADAFHTSGFILEYGVIDDARDVLKKLSEEYKLIIITSRKMLIKKHTLDWIGIHFPDVFDDVIHAGFYDLRDDKQRWGHTKADIAKEISADFLIDDQVKHVFTAAAAGVKGLLFGDYAWNQVDTPLPKNVMRVKDWQAVEDYFLNK